MKQKKIDLIESAIKLFAEKGFQSTSVQDIVQNFGISKGAFYTYFTSKEELLLAIFEHYYTILRSMLEDISKAELEPREKIKKQIQVQFEFFFKNRDFIVMHIREQNHSINKELRKYLQKNIAETLTWYKRNLFMIYGKEIEPFLGDIILFLDGIRHAYLKAAIFGGKRINAEQLSAFIMNRLDELEEAFREKREQPVAGGLEWEKYLYKQSGKSEPETLISILYRMKETLEELTLDDTKKQELLDTIHFLLDEAQKKSLKKYLFQGLLTNFKGIDVLEKDRQKVCRLLNIEIT